MKVYLVIECDYVRGVFSSKEKADKLAAYYQGVYRIYVEEYEVDEPLLYPEGQLAWSVRLDSDGSADAKRIDPNSVNTEMFARKHMLRTDCWAEDAQHAIRISRERMMQSPELQDHPIKIQHCYWLGKQEAAT